MREARRVKSLDPLSDSSRESRKNNCRSSHVGSDFISIILTSQRNVKGNRGWKEWVRISWSRFSEGVASPACRLSIPERPRYGKKYADDATSSAVLPTNLRDRATFEDILLQLCEVSHQPFSIGKLFWLFGFDYCETEPNPASRKVTSTSECLPGLSRSLALTQQSKQRIHLGSSKFPN